MLAKQMVTKCDLLLTQIDTLDASSTVFSQLELQTLYATRRYARELRFNAQYETAKNSTTQEVQDSQAIEQTIATLQAIAADS